MEEVLIEGLVGILGTHGEKDVAADELVHYLTVSRQTGKLNVLLLKLHQHLLNLPVYIPRLHCVEAPRLEMVPSVRIQSEEAIEGDGQYFLIRRQYT